MRPIWHLISSFLLAIFTNSIGAGLIVFLTGVFVDLDHVFDFWVSRPKNFFGIRKFLDSKRYIKKRIFVLFHSWEYLIILVIFAYYLNWPILLSAFIAGLALHYLLDVYNLLEDKMHILSYFMVFRIAKRFTVKKK